MDSWLGKVMHPHHSPHHDGGVSPQPQQQQQQEQQLQQQQQQMKQEDMANVQSATPLEESEPSPASSSIYKTVVEGTSLPFGLRQFTLLCGLM
jgi:transcription initiation factor TFIID subunit TAF12